MAKKAAKPKVAARGPRSLRILMIASEAQPFSKTGGLADVVAALPKALGRLGHEVTVITPRYRGAPDGPVAGTVALEVAGHRFRARLLEQVTGPGARVLLLDCPELYDRGGIYYEGGADYPDNPIRYAFLSAAAIDFAAQQRRPSADGPAPFDIIHTHDWQGGLAPVYARTLGPAFARPAEAGELRRGPAEAASGRVGGHPGTVLTIHNLAYQGIFDKSWVPRLGLGWQDFTMNGFEFFDRLGFLKAGINFADAITTVSPTYADEIQRAEYGHGLDGVIRSRRDRLTGILNGIDHDEWNPAADPYLPEPFDAERLAAKGASKRALLECFGIPVTEAALARPVVGMVSRMVDQKGLDLIAAVAASGALASLDATFTIVGTGEPRYQDMWRFLSQRHPNRIGAFIGFDEQRAHLVEAGADMFLMPSRFEPCGLNQMYSLRYGTVPIVRAVGGLVDTVRPYNPKNGQGTGFLFSDYEPGAMLRTLQAALAAFANKKIWTRLQKNGMRADFSWDRSAAEYVKIYTRLCPARTTRRVSASKG